MITVKVSGYSGGGKETVAEMQHSEGLPRRPPKFHFLI